MKNSLKQRKKERMRWGYDYAMTVHKKTENAVCTFERELLS